MRKFSPPPGRIFAANPNNTFADFADAINTAFARWDRSHLHEFVLDRLAAQSPLKTYPGTDACISQDGRSLLIRVAGKHPPSDLEFSKRFTSTIESLAARVNEDHLQLDISGGYAIAATVDCLPRNSTILGCGESLAGLRYAPNGLPIDAKLLADFSLHQVELQPATLKDAPRVSWRAFPTEEGNARL